jgi:phosphatidylserine/phosphatidylglycerophosphate/cardiolipin synthase-like enzyme
MSTTATGRLVATEDGSGLANMTVVLTDVSALFSTKLASKRAESDGKFSLTYEPDTLVAEFGRRTLQLQVLDRVCRLVFTHEQLDVEANVLSLGDVKIPKADATGWLVTLGTGAPKPAVRTKNAVSLLVDNVVAWERVASVINAATTSISLMQLMFDVPPKFAEDIANEEPEMVFTFGAPALTAQQLRAVGAMDQRPERLLLNALQRNPNIDIRILINDPDPDVHLILAAAGAVVLLPGLGLLALIIAGLAWAFGAATSVDEVREYFESTALLKKHIQGATTSFLGPTHAKLAIVDGKTAVSIASPFDQGYYGDASHLIDDPRRGSKDNVPIHDVSLAVTGPVVYDLHETYRMHWNDVTPQADHLATIAVPPEAQNLDGHDAFASLQVVRTLDTGRFDEPAKGEKGVLEAYLRAIANAESYIYLENQYLTNDTIGAALLAALTDPGRPNLNVVLLVNIEPDIPRYPRWQRKLITRIREGMVSAGQTEAQRKRFGAFTRWTHEPAVMPDRPRPRIAPNYVHSKVGIVDGTWATLGSANLDGASLDYFQLGHALHLGDVRNTEVNFLILNGIEEQPATPAVDILRRRLWSEHLGLEAASGIPNPEDPLLVTAPPGGWVQLWHSRAAEKLAALKADPANPKRIRILPWPEVDETLDAPREHLAALLGVDKKQLGVDPVGGTRRFSFKKGTWRDPTVEIDT